MYDFLRRDGSIARALYLGCGKEFVHTSACTHNAHLFMKRQAARPPMATPATRTGRFSVAVTLSTIDAITYLSMFRRLQLAFMCKF